ncbi:radical SAM/SPASM domain-containing protein [Aliivibrio fischeri]|uniref:radical SAM/SPASM domain-containing protein n=1 Tax=Aliivibrio fischeri TaxID=668 RepID=UPI001F3FD9EF|nr:radical SAM/SPASM domain-containing protein [Aliivibrio fischeri]MCE7534923.1 SPASM domain-containing protein [Aliivibrio fischeri]MCE7559365.1 SPASM domain-containing protein [Aliivibrio fischeri]
MELLNIEIEINSICNRKCDYCPVSIMEIPKGDKYIDQELFDIFIFRLNEINYSGRISFHLYNEPLLHKGLEDLVFKLLSKVPSCKPILFTNGDLLTEARYNSLMKSGVSKIVITSHSGKEHPKRPDQIVQFPKELDLTNRGGKLESLPKCTFEHLNSKCYAPSEMFVISITGDVLLCYEDANRNNVLGNIKNKSFKEIYYSERYTNLRNALTRGNRSKAADICKLCTNLAHSKSGRSDQSEKFWEIISND